MIRLSMPALVGLVFALAGCNAGEPEAQTKSDIFADLGTAVPATCEGGGIATGDEATAIEEYDFRQQPGEKAARVINPKASEIFEQTMYHGTSPGQRLKELCRQDAWVKVRMLEPEWATDIKGWVPASILRPIEKDSSGKRLYDESDFYWDKDATRYKAQITAAVNRIVRENANCPDVDTGSIAKSPSRSSPGKAVFFVTCSANPPFNIWFEPADAGDSNKSFAAIQNINRTDAVLACEDVARRSALNPQTVDFSKFLDVAFVPLPSGRSRLVSSFTAKNSFGVEKKFRITCLFEGQTMLEHGIAEAIE